MFGNFPWLRWQPILHVRADLRSGSSAGTGTELTFNIADYTTLIFQLYKIEVLTTTCGPNPEYSVR